MLEPCPVCKDKMKLHGDEPGLLLGCEGHGFWIDADTIEHTGLARPYDAAAIERLRADEDAIAANEENRQRAEQQRAEDRLSRERAEAAVRKLEPRLVHDVPSTESPRSRAAVEAAYLETLDPRMRSLWRRVAELERQNAELERRVRSLEGSY